MARDPMIQEATIADLERDGFTLASVQEPDLMASDPSRNAANRKEKGKSVDIAAKQAGFGSAETFERVTPWWNSDLPN